VAEGAIEGLVELLAECAEHARAVMAATAGAPPPPPSRRRTASGGGASGGGAQLQGGALFSTDALESVPAISAEAAAETVAATAWASGGGGGAAGSVSGGGGPRPLSAGGSRRASGAAPQGLTSSPARRRRPSGGASGIVGRQRPRVSMQSSVACLVCASDGHESCGFCPLSSALKGLLRLLSPDPAVLARFVSAGGVGLLFEVMMPEVGRHHSRLMQSLASLLAVALAGGGSPAQDEARAAGGIEVLVAALSSMTQQRQPGIISGEGFDIYQLRFAVLNALQLAVAGNPANKVAFREAAGFVPLVALLRQLLAQRAGGPRPIEDGEHLETACLSLLAVVLPDSPANQAAAAKMGVAALLLSLLCGPNADHEAPQLRSLSVRCLSLLAESQPAAAEEAVAAGAVQAMVGRLQHEPAEEEEQVRRRGGAAWAGAFHALVTTARAGGAVPPACTAGLCQASSPARPLPPPLPPPPPARRSCSPRSRACCAAAAPPAAAPRSRCAPCRCLCGCSRARPRAAPRRPRRRRWQRSRRPTRRRGRRSCTPAGCRR
jgi:hypothetical protein